MPASSGTFTFLFTDIVGSTSRWEEDPDAMRLALMSHDQVLRSAIDGRGGRVFKHTGDGMCAAFVSARAALDAAAAAQRGLALPVRIGVATGEATEHGDDYFGPVLNRAARVMAAAQGGQIVVAASTANVVAGIELVDLGEHRLRGVPGATRLFQLCAPGLRVDFPPLRSVSQASGRLPTPRTSFVGRRDAVATVSALVVECRCVTLSGVGGVGKTRLALEVGRAAMENFPDGVWFIELASVSDPRAVEEAVATALGLTAQPERSTIESIAVGVTGRRLLVVLDNCEHVREASADVADAILGASEASHVLATSREELGLAGERVWSVPALSTAGGTASEAVALFAERVQAVVRDFAAVTDGDTEAIVEICRRLDGIPLAIELAAARMVSMTVAELRDRLKDRFDLLARVSRGPSRHQTLRNAVQWSFDLLDDDERAVLCRASVFTGGFDLAAISALCDDRVDNDYRMLGVLESLVRKSLVVTDRTLRRTRYRLLETIRHFGEEQLMRSGTFDDVRHRHARYYATQAVAQWMVWDSPQQRTATDWVDVEFANLRAAFRFAVEHGDAATAATIAAHTTRLSFPLLWLEPIGWALEVLGPATVANVPHLARLYSAASLCSYIGKVSEAVEYVGTALSLEADRRYQPFEPGWTEFLEAVANVFAGRIDRYIEVSRRLALQTGGPRVLGLGGLTWALPAVGRADEAMEIADEALASARDHGNPFWTEMALYGCGRAFADTDPQRALYALRQGVRDARENRHAFWEAVIAQDAALLEALHGDRDEALALYDDTIESLHVAGNYENVAATLAYLAVCFERFGEPEVAATLYGASSGHGSLVWVIHLDEVTDRLGSVLGVSEFDHYVSFGSSLSPVEAVRYAREQIAVARSTPA